MSDKQQPKKPNVPMRMTPGFAFSFVDRCLQECLGRRAFGQADAERVWAHFFKGGTASCVYCGSPAVERWDHLLPVVLGGETVIGNMVPACRRCDDSKQALPFDEWMTSKAKHSPRSRGVTDLEVRIDRIRGYARHFGYEPVTLDNRLTQDERDRLEKIRQKTAALRQDIEDLIQVHRHRVNGDQSLNTSSNANS